MFQQAPQQAIQQYFLLKYLASEGEKLHLADKSPLKEQLETMRANAVAGAMVNEQRDGFNVSQDAIQNFYDRNKSRYEQAKIKIIFLRFQPQIDTSDLEKAAQSAFQNQNSQGLRSEADTKKLADDIQKQLKAGAKFEAMVAKYSDDPESKAKGGEFGNPITQQSPYPEDLKKTILAMKKGEISAPIRESNGYYFIEVTEKTVQPLNDVLEPIIQEIRQTHLNDYMNGLNQQFTVQPKKPDFFVKPDEYLKK